MFFVHIFKYVFSVQFLHYIAVSASFFWAFLRALGASAVVGLSCYMSEPFGRSAALPGRSASVCVRITSGGWVFARPGLSVAHCRRVRWWAGVLMLSAACLHRRSLSASAEPVRVWGGPICPEPGPGRVSPGDIGADGGGANNPLPHPKNQKSRKTC